MPSKRKIDSARANGKKSHGPATPEGRKISSMNALKHGLNAHTVVLPRENLDEYNMLLDSYIQELQPAGLLEMDLVVEMVNARWRQRRCNQIETGLFDEQLVTQKEKLEGIYDSYEEATEYSFAFRALSESGNLPNLNRMQSRLERTFTHALRDLLRLREIRESRLDAAKKDGEKRTESQQRPPSEHKIIAPAPINISEQQPEPAAGESSNAPPGRKLVDGALLT
jgi:hypothetical protein